MLPIYEWSLLFTIATTVFYFLSADKINPSASVNYKTYRNLICVTILVISVLQLVRYYIQDYIANDILLRAIACATILYVYLQFKIYILAAKHTPVAIDKILSFCMGVALVFALFLNGGGLWYGFKLIQTHLIDGGSHTGLIVNFSYYRVPFLILVFSALLRITTIILVPRSYRLKGLGLTILSSIAIYILLIVWNSLAMRLSLTHFTAAGFTGTISILLLIWIDNEEYKIKEEDNKKIRDEIIVKDNLIDSYFANTGIAAALVSNEGRLIKSNLTFKDIFGFSDLSENKPSNVSHRDEVNDLFLGSNLINALKESMSGRISKTLISLKKNDQDYFYEFYFKPNINTEGSVTSIYIEGHDTTEIVRANIALDNERRIQSLGKLAAGIAHDFNNILTSVIGISELTKEDLSDSKDIANIDLILKAAYRGTELTGNLLNFSRKSSTRHIDFDLTSIANESIRLVKRAGAKLVKYTADLELKTTPIHGDPSEIYSVIMNLLINAGDAIKSQGEVVLSLSQGKIQEKALVPYNQSLEPGDYYIIKVKDNGMGIREQDIENIFEPFYTTKSKGTGLGLSQALSIVTAHRGAIKVTSCFGEGTEFSIYLPAANSSNTEVA